MLEMHSYRFHPYLWLLLTFLSLTIICSCMSSEKKEIIQKAEEVSLVYFKETYGIDVVFTDHKFIPADLSHTVSLTGYVQGHKDQEIFAMVDYGTYTVKTGSVPDAIKSSK
ncbi:hypothetical protein SAMN05720606_104145 [Paenibacillus polysaccharolyticus]|uniref:DUF1433 domain-containing protein n=1 Tax=Paenibacillus polysaccharolyticus TaxID=582692 RepID=A0A1G5FBI6_9BACL|nr:hypothetical protein SAMN05720606_104145 [Paenibacillus polysaccharolyticus]